MLQFWLWLSSLACRQSLSPSGQLKMQSGCKSMKAMTCAALMMAFEAEVKESASNGRIQFRRCEYIRLLCILMYIY